MSTVTLSSVRKVYPGEVEAVKGVDLDIADGEFVVLVGPSGCGKSTTLRMVAGLEEISDGTIAIGERVINDVPPKDRDIAMVFQNYALYPHMTVYKNMAFGLKLRKTPRPEIDRRVRETAALLGIEPLLDRKPKALSGGQRQRVAVGRAIVRDPACFLFDEPLSNLDAKLRVQTRAELKRLHHRLKTTTIYVTHDQEEAMTLGDRVVVMSDGRIQQCDTPLNVFHKPANRFVAQFVGMPPMNQVEGELTKREDGVYFVGGGVDLRLRDDHAQRVTPHVGRPVVLGVRPAGLHLRQSENAGDPRMTIAVTVGVSEPLGSTMDLFTTTSVGEPIVARVKAEPIDASQAATLYLDPDQLHIFEPDEYGTNLTLGGVVETPGRSEVCV
ncbi:MAG: sn-glycerol-3-phosphate ABC transporter ATP-binding protein UgpC [Planctomycetota bacterium]